MKLPKLKYKYINVNGYYLHKHAQWLFISSTTCLESPDPQHRKQQKQQCKKLAV